jgi:hypothetical protein
MPVDELGNEHEKAPHVLRAHTHRSGRGSAAELAGILRHVSHKSQQTHLSMMTLNIVLSIITGDMNQ